MIEDYKDVLFYLFILGFMYTLWQLHGYFEHRQKEKEKKQTTKNMREWKD